MQLDTDENGIRMNRYFVQHPEMVLGDMVMESTRFGMDSACKAREGADLSEQLAQAIQFLQAEIKPYELEEPDEEDLNWRNRTKKIAPSPQTLPFGISATRLWTVRCTTVKTA